MSTTIFLAKNSSMKPKRISPLVCVLINQTAFPGLGTKLAGRRVGYAQMAVMLVGFFLFVGFMMWYFVCAIRSLQDVGLNEESLRASYRQAAWIGWWGVGLCIAAWCWAGISSISILRSSAQPPALSESPRR